MKRIFGFIILLLSLMPIGLQAQTLTAQGPEHVTEGSTFRVEYTANTRQMEGFHLGQFPADAFEVVYGPGLSSGNYFINDNGKISQTFSTTYTYTLLAKKAGKHTIKGATARLDGKQVKSNDLHILVTAQGQQSAGGGSSSSSDVFMQVTASKKHLIEGEPLLLTYRLYSAVDLANLKGELPDNPDYLVNRLTDPNQPISRQMETIGGRPYVVLKYREYLLFPQKTGHLQIPKVPFEVSIVRRMSNIDEFEAFMNGGSGEIYDNRIIQSPAVDIQVDALQSKPADFSGGVGQFAIASSLDNTTPQTNDVITLKVRISGKGNLNVVPQPTVTFPDDFDTYEPQRTDSMTLTANGYEGTVEYEYTAVPRNPGEYDLAPVTLTYYDIDSHDYKTLSTEGYHLKVTKGSGNAQPGVIEQRKADDIYPIHDGPSSLQREGSHFFGSSRYLIILGVLLLIFVSLFIIFRQRAIDNADIVKSRGRRANKVATRRLKKARKLMKAGQSGAFFDETLRALWGYVGDRLNMPVEQLSRENITGRLQERHVSETTTTQFIEAIDECEFERYAPGDPQVNMGKVYEKAMTAIEHIEDDMKRKVRKAPKTALLLCLLMMTLSAQAVSKQEADVAYKNGEYQKAIELYEQVLRQGVSSDVYYNLGNAYFRTEKLTLAILNYERALRLSPSDGDIRHNLQVAQSKTVDKLSPQSQMFFVTWYRSLVNMMQSDVWAHVAVVALALAIVLALLYLFASRTGLRKLGFFGGGAMLLLFLLANLFAWQQKHYEAQHDEAIVMSPSAPVKTMPAGNGKDAFVLHEGSKVTITDDTMKEWLEVSVSDGRKGWIKSSDIERI